MSKVTVIKGKIARLEAKSIDLDVALAAAHVELEALRVALGVATAEEGVADSIAGGLPVGTAVGYAFGRDKTRAGYVGVIRAVKTDERGAVTYRIETGEGFDTVLHTVPSAAIKDIISTALGAGHYTEVA